MRRVLTWTSAASLALAALACVPSSSATAAGPLAADPVRILVIGDSMTQGSAGDWTWRYRLWEHLTAAGVPVEFVGPRDDLFDNVTASHGSHAYVDPAFDRDHAARWGMAMTFPDEPIAELVADYQPDLVVEMLGVNDLTFLGETPEEAEGVLRDFIADARSASPGVDLVLSRLPQPWLDKVPAFNSRVDAVAAELSTVESRIVSAQSDAGLVREEDTWDRFHPNSHGDLKIAAAVADALSTLGIGPPASRPLPFVPRGPRIPPTLSATSKLRDLHLKWKRSPGAQESEVWLRDVTVGATWQRVAQDVTETSYEVTGLPGWHRIQLQVAPIKWDWRAAKDAWSNVVEVEVTGSRLGAVRQVWAARTRSGAVRTSGKRVLGAIAYRLVAAHTRSCAHPPAAGQYAVVEAAKPKPAKRFSSGPRAVWVRWVAVRGELVGGLARSSTDCVRPRP